MFLVPPKIPFLPNNTETQKLLCFGDPNNLKDGIILKEKKSQCEKIIYSLYDMDMDTKYITEQGHTVRRISESQVVVKKKAAPVPSNAEKATVTAMSNPINIPSAPNSFRHGSFLAKRSLNRNSSSADSESHSHSHSHSDPVSESIGSFGKFGTSPLSPSFEDFDFLPARAPKHKEQEENYQSHSFKIVVDIQTPNVPGEKIERITEDVILVKSNNRNVQGTLYLTNYQLIFSPLHKMDETNHNTPFFMDEKPSINNDDLKSDTIMLPLTTILKFEKVDRQNGTFMFGGDNSYAIDLFTKDFRRTIRLELDPKGNSRVVLCDLLAKYIYPRSIGDIFATSSGYKPPDTGFNGWELYDATTEYTRMGLGDEKSGWTLNTINSNYTLSDTYPQTLVVPIGLTEEDLISVAQFRSKGRIPVLAWRNKHTGVSLCRCSQPRTGMSRSYRCKADEKLIRCIQHMNRHSAKLHIMDARPMTNAIANMALGGGYENISYYPDCELEFLGIANIHSVRDSWNKLRDLCDLQGGDEAKSNSSSWLSQLENTHWFDHLLSILTGAVRIAQLIDKQKESVLIHCSDGWDRTPQVCSLAQLLLDRDYRTIKGFCILIEKEWLHFGHKFADRCGLSFEDPAYKDAERSPIFLQFLDAVWQIMQQFPWSFEFNENLLVTIMEHLYSSRFGTFLMNTDKERKESKLQEISSSLWTYILYNNNNNNNNNNNYYINPFYQPHKEPIVLNPSLDIKNLQFWKSYYLKYITLDCENSNHYIRIGREMRDTIQSLMCDVDILQKENELLVQELKLLKDASAKAAKTELHNKNKNNNNNNNNGAPIKFSKDHKNPSSLLIRENLSCDWIDIENGSGNEN